MRPMFRAMLLGVFVVVLFCALYGHHPHPTAPQAGHHTAGHHALTFAALQAPESLSIAPAGPEHGEDGHMLLRLCLAVLIGTFGLVAWLFGRGVVRDRVVAAPVLSRPPPRPAARSRPPTGRLLVRLCVLRT